MALNHTKHTLPVAQRTAAVCTQLKAALYAAQELLETNSDLGIDWAAVGTPAYINEDVDGNVDGEKFSRGEVANAIGTLDNFVKLMTNQAASQGDHLGNVNKLADVNA